VLALGQHPRQRHLRRGDPSPPGDLPHRADDGQAGAQRVLLEARQPTPEVILGQVVEGGEPPGEEAPSQRRERQEGGPHEVGEGDVGLLSISDEADRALESSAVADAVRSLRPEHREVLLEIYYHGRSVAEAAAVLGIPAGTVKSWTFYALRALQLALEERGLAL